MGSTVEFSEDDAKVIAALVEHYDQHAKSFSVGDLSQQTQLPVEQLKKILLRFSRYEMVSLETRSGDYWSIEPNLLTTAEHLSAPAPPRDYWKEVEVWFRSRPWSLPVFLILVGLPLVVTYIQMLVTVLKWTGVIVND